MNNLHKQQIDLKSSRLDVKIAHPGTLYSGSRFDWTGFVTDVTLDGRHTFCAPESPIPGQGSGGHGFCNEFGISTPIGYSDAKPGEKFPKLGAGLLTRPIDEQDYFFFNKYEVSPFDVSISNCSDSVVFKTEPSECNGYAVSYSKKIAVNENTMTVSYSITNVGSKGIKTEEYCHNFICINNNHVGPGYILKFLYDIKVDEVPDVMTIKDREIHWIKVPSKDFYCRPQGFTPGASHCWELNYEPEKVGVKEYSDFPTNMVAVWGTTHVVSPEVFINIDLAPGETLQWSRKYEFFTY